MPWEKSSSDLVELFRQTVPSGPNIQQKKMFGYLCAFVNGYVFAGLFKQSMVFRLPPADRAAFLDQPGTSDFEPMPGHKMTGFVMLQDPFAAGEEELTNWMKCALQHVSTMPAKVKEKGARKKAPAARKKPK